MQWDYFIGDPVVLNKMARGFAFFSALYGLPEYDSALSQRQAIDLPNAVYGKH